MFKFSVRNEKYYINSDNRYVTNPATKSINSIDLFPATLQNVQCEFTGGLKNSLK